MDWLPRGEPGPLTEQELFVFQSAGFLIVPGALTPAECAACLAAAERVHATLDLVRAHTVPAPLAPPAAGDDLGGEWRQLGCMYEHDPAFEALIDHPSVLEKIGPLGLGGHFVLHSSWCTMVPAGHEGGGFHRDASGPSLFDKLANPPPLVQIRVWRANGSTSLLG